MTIRPFRSKYWKGFEKENGFDHKILFPVRISANETKKYQLNILEKVRDALPVQLMLSEDKLSVENKYYKAHFSFEDDERGGQVNGIELKDFENQLLKRSHIAMYWLFDLDSMMVAEDFVYYLHHNPSCFYLLVSSQG